MTAKFDDILETYPLFVEDNLEILSGGSLISTHSGRQYNEKLSIKMSLAFAPFRCS